MSGVILATAIGSGVAAAGGGLAVASAGIAAGTTLYGGAKSFSDANKARKRGEAAQRDLLKSMEEAKRRIDVNAYEQLSIPKEPFELMREASLVQGATGMQAGVEGETRGAAATAGRIQMAQQAQQAGIRSAMGEQMMAIDKLVAQDDARIQAAIRDAEEDRAAYIEQGVGTLGSIAEGLSTSYAEGNFGQARQGNADLRQSEGVASPDTRVGRRQMREGGRLMRQDMRQAGDLSGFGFDQQFDITAPGQPDAYVPPGMTNRELNQARRGERQALNQQRRDLGISRDEFARRRAEAEAFVPRAQERPSAKLATPYDLDYENRVGRIYGHPDIPDDFGPHARDTMTMYRGFSEMPKGPRPPGRYSGLGFPTYVMYDQSRFE